MRMTRDMDGTAEGQRLRDADVDGIPWRRFGPYLSERQWGTVREDYSENGDAWNYFTHEQARSCAYRWGEDGIAGISDDRQHLCVALALWNGKDPILKERMFGLTNSEGNHGEDVKEYYFYVDNTPTHSYMRYLYKYPQAAYPYEDLVSTNRTRSKTEQEYELIDTGVFGEDRYFDVEVEYAKADPDDILMAVTVHNRGPEAAELHVLPTVWYRNTWWDGLTERPSLRSDDAGRVLASHHVVGDWVITASERATWLFTENETNATRLFGGENLTPFVKDGINDFVIEGRSGCVNPEGLGTKAAAHHALLVPAGASHVVTMRMQRAGFSTPAGDCLGPDFDRVLQLRRREADEFYGAITPSGISADSAAVMRQALAGMLWSKQFYYFDVDLWLQEHHAHPLRCSDPGPAEHAMVPHAERRHSFHAGQVGVPLVRGMGPGLPLRCAQHGRPGLHAQSDRAHALGCLPPPERPAPRVRVEFRRRQPAGACMGNALRAPCGASRTWRSRH